MLDLVIKNGLVVDGSGLPGFQGDVAIAGGKIVGVGRVGATSARTLDARGRVVAPGFVDPHTHFDAQLCWDPHAQPSVEHGVTTIVPGNCSLSLAPLRAGQREAFIRMFRQIEEMPAEDFGVGVDWAWGESFPAWTEQLVKKGLGINVAPLVGHSVLRMFVMGEAAQQRVATADELAAMCRVLDESLEGGAVGLSTSFVDIDESLRPVPSRWGHADELDALCAVLARHGKILQIVHEFFDTELTIARIDQLAALSLKHGITTTLSPLFHNEAFPDMVPRVLGRVEEQWKQGARVWPQVQTRPIDISFTLGTRSLLYLTMPTWYGVSLLPSRAAKIAAFKDPATREKLVREATPDPNDPFQRAVRRDFGETTVRQVRDARNKAYEGKTLAEVARERGQSAPDAMIDLALSEDLYTWFGRIHVGHRKDDEVGQMLAHPYVHIGAGDGGAHIGAFATYGDTGYLFSNFVRKTHALRLEEAVKKLTFDPCSIWGLGQRGLLRPGYAADVVVFDPETIDRGPETAVNDLPSGGMRWTRAAVGVDAVVVGGALAYTASGGYTDARRGEIVSRR
jgi:N-acyl-D-aspartate/D-glutamate deacylase